MVTKSQAEAEAIDRLNTTLQHTNRLIKLFLLLLGFITTVMMDGFGLGYVYMIIYAAAVIIYAVVWWQNRFKSAVNEVLEADDDEA